MPCDSIRTCQVAFKVQHFDHLVDALKADGLHVFVNGNEISFIVEGYKRIKIANDQIQVPKGSEYIADRIKVAYSNHVVNVVAKKYAWAMRKVAKNEYVAARR